MSENLAAKHYKGNKKRLQKKFIKDTKTFPKKKRKKEKKRQYDKKNLSENKNKSFEKNIIE